MNKIFLLIKPYRYLFMVAVFTLIFASFFNAALTGMITTLMDGVLTTAPATVESRADQIFGYKDKLDNIKEFVEELLPLETIKEQAKLDLINPLPWAILAFIIFTLQAIFDFVGTYIMGRVGLLIVVSLRQQIIDKVVFLSMDFYQSLNTGEILTRINADIQRIQTAVSVKMGELLKETTNSLMFLVLAFVLDWKLSLTLFVLVPMIGIPISIFTKKIRRYASVSQGYLGELTSHLKEVLVGIRIVKSFQKEEFESEKLGKQNQSFLNYALRELKIVALTTPIMSMIGMVVILSFVWYGGTMIQKELMTRGDFLFYLLTIYQLYQPIKRIARANSEIQQAVGVLPRIEEILSWENNIVETKNPKRFDNYPEINEISFKEVSFQYEGAEISALNKVSLNVKQGAVVALVGASGSGKSTLVNLIPRFYDASSGTIAINNTNIRDLTKKDLRALVAVVTQDTILFDDTVHNNIAYGMPHVSREKVIEAAKKAFAHQFIEDLPSGYETKIGEAGNSLSGGQRQRISIARAFLKDAPILILDEATSALDTESEREVQMALDNLIQTKTTFVIAHRLSTVRAATEILVLEKGEIVERGNHESLLKGDGIYKKLTQMQEERSHAV